MIRRTTLLLTAACLAFTPALAHAVNWKGWQGGGGLANPTIGSYHDGLHWQNFLPPTASQSAVFDTSLLTNVEPKYIYFGDFEKRATPNNALVQGGPATVTQLQVKNGDWTFDFSAFDEPDLFGANQDKGSLTAFGADVDGALHLTGDGFLSADSLVVGFNAVTTIDVSSGADFKTLSGRVGVAHLSTVNVTGAGSRLEAASLAIGEYSEGRLNVSSGAVADVDSLTLAFGFDGVGKATVSGTGLLTTGVIIAGGYQSNVATLRAISNGKIHADSIYVGLESEVEATSGGSVTIGNVPTPIANTVAIGPAGYYSAFTTKANIVVQSGGELAGSDSDEGIVHTVGNLSVLAGGKLNVYLRDELGNPAHVFADRFEMTGQTTLAGTFSLLLPPIDPPDPEFLPPVGGRYEIIHSDAGVTGRFAAAEFPAPPPNVAYKLLYAANSVTLAVVADLAGDYDLNGRVDGADLLVWQRTLGLTGALLPADGNKNGAIDADDLTVWRTHYGAVAPLLASVPEPATLVLAAFTLLKIPRRKNP